MKPPLMYRPAFPRLKQDQRGGDQPGSPGRDGAGSPSPTHQAAGGFVTSIAHALAVSSLSTAYAPYVPPPLMAEASMPNLQGIGEDGFDGSGAPSNMYDRWARSSANNVLRDSTSAAGMMNPEQGYRYPQQQGGDRPGLGPDFLPGSGTPVGGATGWSLPRLPGLPNKAAGGGAAAASGAHYGGSSRDPLAVNAQPPPFYLKNDILAAPSRGSPQKGRPRDGSAGPYPRSARGDKRGGQEAQNWRETLAHSGEVASLLRRGRERAAREGAATAGGDGGRDDGTFGAWKTRPPTEQREPLAMEKWAGNNWGSFNLGARGGGTADTQGGWP